MQQHRTAIIFWLAAGLAVWFAATVALAFIGDVFLENGWAIYGAFVITICVSFVGLFILLARWRGVYGPDRLTAAVAFSIAGMAGEVPVLMSFPHLVPALPAGTAGPFAAFLFAGYTALLIYTLRHAQADQRE